MTGNRQRGWICHPCWPQSVKHHTRCDARAPGSIVTGSTGTAPQRGPGAKPLCQCRRLHWVSKAPGSEGMTQPATCLLGQLLLRRPPKSTSTAAPPTRAMSESAVQFATACLQLIANLLVPVLRGRAEERGKVQDRSVLTDEVKGAGAGMPARLEAGLRHCHWLGAKPASQNLPRIPCSCGLHHAERLLTAASTRVRLAPCIQAQGEGRRQRPRGV